MLGADAGSVASHVLGPACVPPGQSVVRLQQCTWQSPSPLVCAHDMPRHPSYVVASAPVPPLCASQLHPSNTHPPTTTGSGSALCVARHLPPTCAQAPAWCNSARLVPTAPSCLLWTHQPSQRLPTAGPLPSHATTKQLSHTQHSAVLWASSCHPWQLQPGLHPSWLSSYSACTCCQLPAMYNCLA